MKCASPSRGFFFDHEAAIGNRASTITLTGSAIRHAVGHFLLACEWELRFVPACLVVGEDTRAELRGSRPTLSPSLDLPVGLLRRVSADEIVSVAMRASKRNFWFWCSASWARLRASR